MLFCIINRFIYFVFNMHLLFLSERQFFVEISILPFVNDNYALSLTNSFLLLDYTPFSPHCKVNFQRITPIPYHFPTTTRPPSKFEADLLPVFHIFPQFSYATLRIIILFLGCRSLRISICFLEAICKYICVVFIELWPKIFCMYIISTPSSNR